MHDHIAHYLLRVGSEDYQQKCMFCSIPQNRALVIAFWISGLPNPSSTGQ